MKKILIAGLLLLPLFAVSTRAADAPADNTKKCADLQAKYDREMKHPLLRHIGAKHTYAEMKKLNCPNLPADPSAPKK